MSKIWSAVDIGDSRNQRQQNKRSATDSRNVPQGTEPKRGRRLRRVFLFGYLAAAVIAGTLLEIALKQGCIQGSFIWGMYKIIAGFIIAGLAKLCYDIYKGNKSLQQPRKEEDTVCEDILIKGIKFFKIAVRNTVLVVLIFILLWVSTIAIWAQFQVASRSVEGWKAFCGYEPQYGTSAGMDDHPKNPDGEKFTAATEANVTEPEVAETLGQDVSSGVDIQIDTVLQEMEEEVQNEKEIEKKAKQMLFVEPMMNWDITEAEKQQMLFARGEYMISLDENILQAQMRVEAYVNDLIRQQLPNAFDEMANSGLKAAVAGASSLDAKLATSTEKDSIISVRLNAYNTYGKATLAKLLSDDFLCYALAYKHENGDREKIVSHCFLSLKWLYERLKYEEISLETRKRIFVCIHYRYNDIMSYSEPGTDQWKRAKLLADVFDGM